MIYLELKVYKTDNMLDFIPAHFTVTHIIICTPYWVLDQQLRLQQCNTSNVMCKPFGSRGYKVEDIMGCRVTRWRILWDVGLQGGEYYGM
jgi:hypothetical protein